MKFNTALILSGGYIPESMEAEIGRLPPAFLPVGTSCLFFHQVQFLKEFADRIIISLPIDFILTPYEKFQMSEVLGIELLTTDPKESMWQSLFSILTDDVPMSDSLIVLMGDTLFENINLDTPYFISTHVTNHRYRWAKVRHYFDDEFCPNKDLAFSGLFGVGNARVLLQQIEQHKNFEMAMASTIMLHDGVLVDQGKWYDFGHINTYYEATLSFVSKRVFNDISCESGRVIKSSNLHKKITGEIQWYCKMPLQLRRFSPSFLGSAKTDSVSQYSTSLILSSSLANLAIFSRLDFVDWLRVFQSCNEYMDEIRIHSQVSVIEQAPSQIHDKTINRLKTHLEQRTVAVNNGEVASNYKEQDLFMMSEDALQVMQKYEWEEASFIHGDLCFSNIFFDFRRQQIFAIDPRGLDLQGNISTQGPAIYDFAKLYHSAIGCYDLIIAGRYDLDFRDGRTCLGLIYPPNWQDMENAFHETFPHLLSDKEDLYSAFMVQLFLSMLPLHNDNRLRQEAFCAVAESFWRKLC